MTVRGDLYAVDEVSWELLDGVGVAVLDDPVDLG